DEISRLLETCDSFVEKAVSFFFSYLLIVIILTPVALSA
ncbi:hypothetical protein EVA_22606, partial [gut metagenome]